MNNQKLKTEFTVNGTLDSVVNLVQRTVEDNGFYLEPIWFSKRINMQQTFYIMIDDKKNQQKICCGGIDFNLKKNNQVQINLDATKGLPGSLNSEQAYLERFFYLVVQRLVQMDILVKKKNNKG